MIIGVDFDNTIVAYDALFHRVASERGLLDSTVPVNKTAVRDHLRARGQEDIWTEMQGEVYGARMSEAEAFSGVKAFFVECRRRGIAVRIISHKTQYPFRGDKHDLHLAARRWLREQGFFEADSIGLAEADVFFELTKQEKLARISACACTHFIDDLPEILGDAHFPDQTERILFDPQRVHPATNHCRHLANWADLHQELFGENTWLGSVENLVGKKTKGGVSCRLLRGGANNQAFRVDGLAAEPLLVKRYFLHSGDPRDRFAHERAFYTYSAQAGVEQMPRAIAWDQAQRLGVFTFENGEPPTTATLSLVQAAMKFFRQLNGPLRVGAALPNASEACFSIEEHVQAIAKRVASLGSIQCVDTVDHEAQSFVQEHLLSAWQAVRTDLEERFAKTERAELLPQNERCVSPSDFGFHNTLVQGDRVIFIDFEYAGWDDPAKLVGDFFCQPEVPVSEQHWPEMIKCTATALALRRPDRFQQRCLALLPAYQIKWACILLNEFTAAGRSRRAFSLGESAAAARRVRQLERARRLVARFSVNA
jgi:hypothetical protein